MNRTSVHPDEVLEGLLATRPRSDRLRKLKTLHEICKTHYYRYDETLRDFSLPTIGRLCEEAGIFKSRVLYNAASRQYVDLILSWAAFSGVSSVRVSKESKSYGGKYPYLLKIGDPAIRSLVQSALVERDDLRTQVNLLKSQTNIIIDQRPLGSAFQGKANTTIVEVGLRLTDSERRALEAAVSEKFLKQEQWTEGTHGEVLNASRRVLYDVGYLTAIRKVLKR